VISHLGGGFNREGEDSEKTTEGAEFRGGGWGNSKNFNREGDDGEGKRGRFLVAPGVKIIRGFYRAFMTGLLIDSIFLLVFL
jgi:hypothetical protein